MEYHKDRFIDYSLMIFNKKNNLVAIFPGNKVGEFFFSHQGLTYGGLILKNKVSFENYTSIFYEVMTFLSQNNFKKIFLKPIPNFYSNFLLGEIDYLMFILDAKLVRRDLLSIIEISNKLSISQTRKQSIKKAIRSELKVVQDDDFAIFWNEILIPNLQTKYHVTPVHSLKEILYLKSKFPDQIKQYNVYWEGKIVAGTTVYETVDVAHAQYISGNPDYNNKLGSTDYLFYELINTFYMNKKYFDFGSSNEDNGRKLNKGLHFFKQSFGSGTVTQDFYEIDLHKKDALKDIYTQAE
jgi:hypothetical protein